MPSPPLLTQGAVVARVGLNVHLAAGLARDLGSRRLVRLNGVWGPH